MYTEVHSVVHYLLRQGVEDHLSGIESPEEKQDLVVVSQEALLARCVALYIHPCRCC